MVSLELAINNLAQQGADVSDLRAQLAKIKSGASTPLDAGIASDGFAGREAALDEWAADNSRYYDEWRGTFLGDMAANGGTLFSDAGINFMRSAHFVGSLAADAAHRVRTMEAISFAVRNPGAVYQGAVDGMSNWFGLSSAEKWRSVGSASAGFMASSVGGLVLKAGRPVATGADYLASSARIARYESQLQRLIKSGYGDTEALGEFSGRIEMLKRGYVLEGHGKLLGKKSDPGGGRGNNGIDRVYRSLSNPNDLVALESKFDAQFSGNSPLGLLGNTNYGRQMSTQWMDRKIDQMMFGPHGDRINRLGENLYINGYQGRYMNVLNQSGTSYFYDLQRLGLR